MALHQLAKITIGVPNVADTVDYYTDFGLGHLGEGRFTTREGGEQLNITHSRVRRLEEILLACDDQDDIARVRSNLTRLGFESQLDGGRLTAIEPTTAIRTVLEVRPRLIQKPVEPTVYNWPGNPARANTRADGNVRSGAVQPLKLGHTVVGTTNLDQTYAFFVDGFGFKVSDVAKGVGAFLRCSTDHHNLLVQAAPVVFMHHSSWQVEDVDQVGRGAMAMLEDNPERHVWGLGRHYAGSNFFWYLKDPAGNFSEYYSDMDCIIDDALWKPEEVEGARGLFQWGSPPPPSFLRPEDLAAMMTGQHSDK
ncbi:VOC family protein [Cumulibacter manganitolerans]|uniref:VOC family protein n=1 Tax=Cumulibacter manganitolerans TaxID=1884992 RepID=UPI001297B28D|nr:VOC family protein [Cumulibacter manganitolerans]